MLTRFIWRQLITFGILSAVTAVALGWYYLRIPSAVGIGQYTLKASLPISGGLYRTSNVTYRGETIGRVTSVEPTERGALVTMSISDRYKIPVDASANVHSVSAVGEQYLDLVSETGVHEYFSPGQTITKGTVPTEIGPALDAANRGLAVLPKDKIAALLDETARAVGGLGPALQRLVDATQAIAGDFKANLADVDDIIENSAPIIDSQVTSRDAIDRWADNLDILAAQSAENDQHVQSILTQAAPTADQVNAVFDDVRESLPRTLANLEIVLDMLKRYHKGVEQLLVAYPQGAAEGQTVTSAFPGYASLGTSLTINQPPPCLTGFLPASQWRSPADTSLAPMPSGIYCKIPQDTPANAVRGARNLPCVDVPGKRAATPRECRDPRPYEPAGTNPWYGDPNQILTCPAPAARCDQPVKPGQVVPAPSVNNGLNPAPADRVPGTPPPVSDPLTRPGSGSVTCNGQQPNPCVYTPGGLPASVYTPQSGELVGPDGVRYTVGDSNGIGDDGWKFMLAPPP
ncbi:MULTISPECIES: MlaD family protein [Mycobacterium]|uniref:Mammalian cell entry protein n=1 Tax=Mycobacterium kiyosense TaxID=2871094 RepID=A0AA37Q243_9MYCO|nr:MULTISPECIES: MlaD family protein [Mycobacterium]BDE14230.1 mammalian cell entry protein [Mycobacterium sp. 20KCMC460]GLB81554.1 mammalian cell entry protein [Mycobacterium kiyosense]GLB89096.1 mammalian cell entry protein [Mycobacterium kiyosense]GLB93747.1 mammalian cell entry protein [Mycobacterium kiyosense]GLC00113.1 mammalian cell entry protein [Mycobacterium kiyosense]